MMSDGQPYVFPRELWDVSALPHVNPTPLIEVIDLWAGPIPGGPANPLPDLITTLPTPLTIISSDITHDKFRQS